MGSNMFWCSPYLLTITRGGASLHSPLRTVRCAWLSLHVCCSAWFFFLPSWAEYPACLSQTVVNQGLLFPHSGLHSDITEAIQTTVLGKQKNFSFSLSFSKAPFSVTLQPFDLGPNGTSHSRPEVQPQVKSVCVYAEERPCLRSLVWGLHIVIALSEPWDPTCWGSSFPWKIDSKRKKRKRLFSLLPSSHRILLSLPRLSWP